MKREIFLYSRGEDSIYRSTAGSSRDPTKRRAFTGASGSSIFILLLAGLWVFFKQ
ncbi:hypothetical protein [Malonomonas rubra]|uniref:hypothetical protein n=1 Tax=Malonomonas rubra TaxID=57040 RepID=UPI0026EE0F4D|nr:hypothetical protein [Malonomonas rubra]